MTTSTTMAGTGSATAFGINNGGVMAALNDLAGITKSASSVVGGIETLVVDVMAFAQIGSAVGGASTSLHSDLVSGLKRVLGFIDTVGGTVKTVLEDYQKLDQDLADLFKSLGLQGGSSNHTGATASPNAHPTTAPAAGTTTSGTPTHTATPQTNGQHQPISDRVVNSIMGSEGAHGEQGGVDEVYGFRQSSHNGYDQIMAARRQYGQGSPEEHQVVADLLARHAAQAGADSFTDPGIRAAIASSAHMRGTGGTRAILNQMISGDVHTSASAVTPDNMAALQQLTPEQFQQQFHDARIAYDQQVYGNTITHQGGHTDTWWHRYGGGLTSRYDREQTLFNDISRQGAGTTPGN